MMILTTGAPLGEMRDLTSGKKRTN